MSPHVPQKSPTRYRGKPELADYKDLRLFFFPEPIKIGFSISRKAIKASCKAPGMKLEPTACRPAAFHYFAEHLPTIDTTDGLLHAAIGISMHALDDVNPADVDDCLLAMATRVRSRVRSNQVKAVLAHLHQVLFQEEGFAGAQSTFYRPLNSYLPAVIESKRGIPVTLGLLYKVVADRAGLHVEGVNAPGHFLVRVRGQDDWMLVDPYFGGTPLSREEAFERIGRVTGKKVPHTRHYLQPATHTQWISRILTNLQHVLANENRQHDLAAMNELHALLDESLY